jgi:D-arabinose 1-dehydrogenase-like Zn-dependent alcohol dehydrogenase
MRAVQVIGYGGDPRMADVVGAAVTSVAEGDKVIPHPLVTCGLCRPCRSGDDVHCGFPGIDSDGGYADYLQTSVRSVVKLDDFQSAIDDLDAGRVRGRAILVP